MLKNLPTYSSILIVSDTPMWKTEAGVHVFEPTLREVEWLSEMFEQVTWIGYGNGAIPVGLARITIKKNIQFIVLPHAVGGKSLIHKFKIIRFIPMMIVIIIRNIRKHKYIHTRGPAVPALIAILISYVNRSRIYWHKYAGNWKQDPIPWAYGLQRFLLRYNPHTVSVNGNWPGEPAKIINLENPCLTNSEWKEANYFAMEKPVTDSINLCFVGALISAKGVHKFMDSLSLLVHKTKIGEVNIVGDGPERKSLEQKAASLSLKIRFLGNIKREEINIIYRHSHIIILPSATEGFPKVIAEAAAFGCVPIVTNVSSIGQYIKHEINGLLLTDTKPQAIGNAIDSLLIDPKRIARLSSEVIVLSSLFTYERYCLKVATNILKQ